MIKWLKLKLTLVLLVAVSSTGCALAAVDVLLGENKATHADDQTVDLKTQNAGNF